MRLLIYAGLPALGDEEIKEGFSGYEKILPVLELLCLLKLG